MNYKSLVAYFAAILIRSDCLAQSTPTSDTEDFRPDSTNQQGKQYPRLNLLLCFLKNNHCAIIL